MSRRDLGCAPREVLVQNQGNELHGESLDITTTMLVSLGSVVAVCPVSIDQGQWDFFKFFTNPQGMTTGTSRLSPEGKW